ncbi:hypothetical protein BDZ89DRAFT_1111974 [Hymenopellis radicata]|nr:hypothetical protein BDZ89DRAFT_1111974 [Hymenopellis radicata]
MRWHKPIDISYALNSWASFALSYKELVRVGLKGVQRDREEERVQDDGAPEECTPEIGLVTAAQIAKKFDEEIQLYNISNINDYLRVRVFEGFGTNSIVRGINFSGSYLGAFVRFSLQSPYGLPSERSLNRPANDSCFPRARLSINFFFALVYIYSSAYSTIRPTTVVRYRQRSPPEQGLTLICIHSTASHKEAYAPFLEDLYVILPLHVLREVWSIDLPNHGEAAIMDEEANSDSECCSWQSAAKTIHAFLSGLGTGVDVDFSAASSRDRTICRRKHFPFVGTLEYTKSISSSVDKVNRSVRRRPDSWASREDAAVYMRKTGAWKHFDERVFELFLNFGLRDFTHGTTLGVTLACTLDQEIVIQSDYDGASKVFAALPQLAKRMNIDLVFAKTHHPMLLTIKQARPLRCRGSKVRI